MVDTHCHIFHEYYDNIDEVINKMENNIIIVNGTNINDNKEVLELVKKYKNVYGALGLHPTEIGSSYEETLSFIEKHLNDQKIVGIGEIGLDYHYTLENKDIQKEVFIKQLNLARKYNKSVIIHSRDAINDTLEILKEYKDIKKDIHSFSGSLESAIEFIKINCRLGIGGVLTFKNAKRLQNIVENVDIHSFLLETDSPYLTPEPYRGSKNEPYNIIYVAKKISEIKGISLEDVLSITTSNAISQFDLDKYLC